MTPQHIEQYKKLKTPFYHYNLDVLERTLDLVTAESNRYGYHIHYALKANVNDAVLTAIKNRQIGADCVSGNEVKKALETGFAANNIVFAGVGKTDDEINFALDKDIFCFNCESLPEMEVINELAEKKNKVAHIALRINPNINAKTHHYITTGLEENKFGINMWEMADVIHAIKSLSHIKLVGLHFHIGSQITDLEIFRSLCLRINEIQEWFYQHHIIVEHINVGGGLGVDYENPDSNLIPDFKGYFEQFHQFLALRPQQHLHFELGRSIVAQCGNLITKVLYVKNGVNTNFAIVDAGMTDLLRPALYQATHKIENLTTKSTELERYDVVGPICESSDCFAKSLLFPVTQRGDIIAIRTAGAYGEVMASNYNLRTTIASYVF
ncbi:MAG: diaminopimelate decarboxylase [Flavobacteriales bacterium]|nr:MAG: diaminopimelate decarboxylase [Flavobacteriales bacterium]MBX2959564.1 diaminopimelate decarboxylase [Flavobacteriales bacterium]